MGFQILGIASAQVSRVWFMMGGHHFYVDHIFSRTSKKPPKRSEKGGFLEKGPEKRTDKGGDGEGLNYKNEH